MSVSWDLRESWVVNNWQYSIPTFLFALVLWKVLSYKRPTVNELTRDSTRAIGRTKQKLSEEEYVGGRFFSLALLENV